jgi:hypothetical protein
MKKLFEMLLAALTLSLAAASAMAAEQAYIPWTFDDYDSSSEVVQSTAVEHPAEVEEAAVEIDDSEEAGELGW